MRVNFRSSELPSRAQFDSDSDPSGVVGAAPLLHPVVTAILTASASFTLILGVLVYLFDRPPSSAVLIPTIGLFFRHNVFGVLGQWLPSFVHPFAFGLFSAVALGPCAASWRYGACAIWCAINVGFEVGQHAAFKSQWVETLHTGAGDWVMMRSVLNYLLHGTFDSGDVFAVVLGALAAAALLRHTDRRREIHHASQ
jgi:hypothetical protein